jgi:sugar lactone lactonase YvrE
LWLSVASQIGLAQTGIISTYAGHPLPVNGALATTQAIVSPKAIALDGAGGFYIACPGKDEVYRVTAGGVISIVAGYGLPGFAGDGGPATSALVQAQGLAVDSAGNLFISDTNNNRVRKVDVNGIITTVAGNGTTTFSGDGGQATASSLFSPRGIAIDSSGNLFIAEGGFNRVRKVTLSGVIITVAGSGSSSSSGDGGQAILAGVIPEGITVDGNGNLYIADRISSRIRKVAPDGIITTIAGTGTNGYNGDSLLATAAQLNNPQRVAVDAIGNFYIADLGNRRVRRVGLDGIITTVAGDGTLGFSGDSGSATSATLRGPDDVAVDVAGNLYIVDGDGLLLADGSNNRIRVVTTDGVINTVAGDGSTGFLGDGGSAASASLANPIGVTFDAAGNLYIADQNNARVRKVTPEGVMSTVAGNGVRGFTGDGVQATSTGLSFVVATAVDTGGNLYIADLADHRIRKVAPNGIISTVAGNGTPGFSGDGGQATLAMINSPGGIAIDSAGNLYISDTGNNRIRKVTPAGVISTVATTGNSPAGMAFDGNGNLFIAFSGTHNVRKLTPGGTLSNVAGTILSAGFSGDGGLATLARLSKPLAVAVDASGNLFIADSDNNRIRKVNTAGIISTVAGNGSIGFSGDGGPATSASLLVPQGVAVDAVGNLYISDTGNSRIRKVDFPSLATLTISTIGSGSGIVTSVPAGINCGATCSASFTFAQVVTLTATPAAGSNFAGWSGDADCTDGSVTMSAALHCIARFTLLPVAVGDSFSVDKGGTLNVAAPGVLGNDTDADGNPMTAVQMTSPIHGTATLNADGSFTYVHNGSDVISDSFTYKVNDGLADSNIATVTLAIDGLFVNQFQPTSSGFVAQFSRPIDASVLNLYTTEAGGFGPADVTLAGAAGGSVSGSVVVGENGGTVTFIRTGGVLQPDTYTATLRSAPNGIKSSTVGLLDGNHDGIPGDDFSATFTVANSSAVVVSVPDFLRGPGQPVNLSGTGIPVTLSDGASATQADLVLKYDPTLLLIGEIAAGSGLPAGSQVQADFSLPDRVHITVTSAAPLGAGSIELLRIAAQVPSTAPYGASQILAISDLSLNSGAIPAMGDDGLHVAAYIGDTTGNRSYSSLDAQRILRVATGLDSGFAAFLMIDPVVVGDITGNGVLSSLDATRLLQAVVGIDRPEIPPLP